MKRWLLPIGVIYIFVMFALFGFIYSSIFPFTKTPVSIPSIVSAPIPAEVAPTMEPASSTVSTLTVETKTKSLKVKPMSTKPIVATSTLVSPSPISHSSSTPPQSITIIQSPTISNVIPITSGNPTAPQTTYAPIYVTPPSQSMSEQTPEPTTTTTPSEPPPVVIGNAPNPDPQTIPMFSLSFKTSRFDTDLQAWVDYSPGTPVSKGSQFRLNWSASGQEAISCSLSSELGDEVDLPNMGFKAFVANSNVTMSLTCKGRVTGNEKTEVFPFVVE